LANAENASGTRVRSLPITTEAVKAAMEAQDDRKVRR
jgi:CO/xanthine dehydrogenase Mo-binding subunit